MTKTANSGLTGGIRIGGHRGHPGTSRAGRPRALASWLFSIAALILVIVVIGGITRLTESGLSITQWKPVTGTLPPLNAADWQAEFDAYKHSSQYLLMNQGMTLAAFKHIYFWEYVHRLLGRLIGVAFALPLIWFWIRKAIPSGYASRLVVLFILGGAQGGIGWLMVKSGLTDRVNVEPAMLAAHLGMALILMAAVVWTACDLLAERQRGGRARLTLASGVTLALLFLQILLGAITAGLRAGQVANTWPLMNDHFVPEGISWWGSFWRTITSDPFLVHFLHRWWAWAAAVALFLLARRLNRIGATRLAFAVVAITLLQIMLGIATVITGVSVPLAVCHQLVGATLLGAAVMAAHRVGRAA
ncbi:MAG: COX15/CtaA family protein [Sphingobium sp.]|nr:COX15/CtaA family protein [Sphingobium sp.]